MKVLAEQSAKHGIESGIAQVFCGPCARISFAVCVSRFFDVSQFVGDGAGIVALLIKCL